MESHASSSPAKSTDRDRLSGIERDGVAQLSLLETALWPLEGGKRPTGTFETSYEYSTTARRQTAHVTVRAPLGLEAFDELLLWGLLAQSLRRTDATLLATPHWILSELGMDVGGSQYAQLRESLLRLAVTSYSNTAFYNPLKREHEVAAFQFLSVLLPTVDGAGNTVDNDRCWRIEWNPIFFRFCQATGGGLLFDLDLYRSLSPAARRLFLKLKDRFHRSKRVFYNLDDLTINGMGFLASRPLKKRKYDLLACVRELLAHDVVALGELADPYGLFLKRGVGRYTVAFEAGKYFERKLAPTSRRRHDDLDKDPLWQALHQLGVDGLGIRRLLHSFDRKLVQRWVKVTDAALNDRPRGFAGFKASPAAYLIDGVQNRRQAPDWYFAHEKRLETVRFEARRIEAATADEAVATEYEQARKAAWLQFQITPDAQRKLADTLPVLLELYRRTDPHNAATAARKAAWERIEKQEFHFPALEEWMATHSASEA